MKIYRLAGVRINLLFPHFSSFLDVVRGPSSILHSCRAKELLAASSEKKLDASDFTLRDVQLNILSKQILASPLKTHGAFEHCTSVQALFTKFKKILSFLHRSFSNQLIQIYLYCTGMDLNI